MAGLEEGTPGEWEGCPCSSDGRAGIVPCRQRSRGEATRCPSEGTGGAHSEGRFACQAQGFQTILENPLSQGSPEPDIWEDDSS